MDKEEYRLPRYKEIPDVGLLLDQVARLVNSYLEPYQDIRLTNSMISNYVKHDIIARPVKKLYYREQIASLIFIAVAKTVLSLDDIVTLLHIQRQNHTPEAAYDRFCDSFEQELHKDNASSRSKAGRESDIGVGSAAEAAPETDSVAAGALDAAAMNAQSRLDYGDAEKGNHATDASEDSYLLYGLIKAVADCIRLKQLLAARKPQ